MGLPDDEKIDYLEETEYPWFPGKAREAWKKGEAARAKLFEDVADTAKLKADYLRLRKGRAVDSERILRIMREEANNELISP